MDLKAELEEAWGWVGLKPVEIVGDNDFGNLIIKDENDSYWRLCPEDLTCEVIAEGGLELDSLLQEPEFQHNWHMSNLVAQARERLGPLRPGYRYCMVVPGPLGGDYGGANLSSVPLRELVAVSGHIAKEIGDLPDGARVHLKITE